MARYKDGALGSFSGKVGNIVGSYWKGRFVMRSAPDVSHVVPTPARVIQQKKFAAMAKYLNPLKGVIKIGFAHDAELRKVTPRNVAMSINMANAMNWNGSDWEISYDSIQLSKGIFLGLDGLVVGVRQGNVSASWFVGNIQLAGLTSSGKEIWTSRRDKVYVVLYNIQRGEVLLNYVQRDAGGVTQSLPSGWQSGQNIQGYAIVIPEIIDRYEHAPIGMTEEEIQLVSEMYDSNLGVSKTFSGNVVI